MERNTASEVVIPPCCGEVRLQVVADGFVQDGRRYGHAVAGVVIVLCGVAIRLGL